MSYYKYSHEHILTFSCNKKGYNGNYVANMIEIPAINVQASTREELRKELRDSLKVYFESISDNHEKIKVIFNTDITIENGKECIKVICYSKIDPKISWNNKLRFNKKINLILKHLKYTFTKVSYLLLLMILKK